MGACGSKKEDDSQVTSVLLLGTSEVGKSTVLKNVKLQSTWFSESELLKLRFDISIDILRSYSHFIWEWLKEEETDSDKKSKKGKKAARKVCGEGSDNKLVWELNTIEEKVLSGSSESLIDSIDQLKDPGGKIAEIVENSTISKHITKAAKTAAHSDFHPVAESMLTWFMTQRANVVQEIAGGIYEPSVDDIMHFRVETRGKSETSWYNEDDKTTIKFIDVGGHDVERATWSDNYPIIDCVVFVIALDDYHKQLRDKHADKISHRGTKGTRLLDSLAVFESVCKLKELKGTGIICVFNKVDLFQTKIQVKSLRLKKFFKDYTGKKNDAEDGKAFIKDKYEQLYQTSKSNRPKKLKFTCFETCSTDTVMMKTFLEKVMAVIKHTAMSDAGF